MFHPLSWRCEGESTPLETLCRRLPNRSAIAPGRSGSTTLVSQTRQSSKREQRVSFPCFFQFLRGDWLKHCSTSLLSILHSLHILTSKALQFFGRPPSAI